MVSRAMGLADPRTVGSGNPGATNVLPNVRSGALRALGTYTDQQSELFPGVPSLTTQGYPATLGSVQ